MKMLVRLSFSIMLLFFGTQIFAQTSDPNFDHCLCLEGIQNDADLCPCAPGAPSGPTTGSDDTSTNPTGNVPDPEG